MPFFQKESDLVQLEDYAGHVRVSVLSDGNCGPTAVFAGGLLQTILTNPNVLRAGGIADWLNALSQNQRGLTLGRLTTEEKRTPQADAFIQRWQAVDWSAIQTPAQLRIQFAKLVALAEQDDGARELFMLGISDSLRTLLHELKQNNWDLYQPFVERPLKQALQYRAEAAQLREITDNSEDAQQRDELALSLETQADVAVEALQNTSVQTDKVLLEPAHLGALAQHFGLSFHSRNANALMGEEQLVIGQEAHNAENYDLVIQGAPSVTILLANGHFTPLVPEGQEDVFAMARRVLQEAGIQVQPLTPPLELTARPLTALHFPDSVYSLVSSSGSSSISPNGPIGTTEHRPLTPVQLSSSLSSISSSGPIGPTARRPESDTSSSSSHSSDLGSSYSFSPSSNGSSHLFSSFSDWDDDDFEPHSSASSSSSVSSSSPHSLSSSDHSSSIASSSGSSSSFTPPMAKSISLDLDDEDAQLQLAIQQSLEFEAAENQDLALAIKHSLEDEPLETQFQDDFAKGIKQSKDFDTINAPRFNEMVDALEARSVTDLLRDYHHLRDRYHNPNDDKEKCDYLATRPDAMLAKYSEDGLRIIEAAEYSAEVVNVIKGTTGIETCRDTGSLKTALIQTLAREATLRDSSYRYLQHAVNLSLGFSSIPLSTHPNGLLNTASRSNRNTNVNMPSSLLELPIPTNSR